MRLESKFSAWHRWSDRSQLPYLKFPGVYILAVSTKLLHGRAFSWLPEIMYVGMTNSIPGLVGRLRQFEETVRATRCSHGGADRVRYRYRSFPRLAKKLFLAVAAINCDVTANTPTSLRAMGRVTKLEYDCLAQYVAKHGRLPEFNDKARSKKYSLTVGRK